MMLHAFVPGRHRALTGFLHGFLAIAVNGGRWRTVSARSRLYIDLPGHGGSAAVRSAAADVIRLLVRATLVVATY